MNAPFSSSSFTFLAQFTNPLQKCGECKEIKQQNDFKLAFTDSCSFQIDESCMAIELTDLRAQEHKQAHSYHSQLHLPEVIDAAALLSFRFRDLQHCKTILSLGKYIWGLIREICIKKHRQYHSFSAHQLQLAATPSTSASKWGPGETGP